MPHSSGGSSHSGGSHSGSSRSSRSSSSSRSSGGSGGGSSRRSSSQPFSGSRRYLYYQGSKPYFVYSNYDIRRKNTMPIVEWILLFSLFFMPFMTGTAFGTFKSVNFPKRIDYFENKEFEFVIEDNLGIFKDEAKLRRSMKDFYEETGIVPAVITVSNDTWNKDYKNLEKYAFDVYVNRFPDERHFLIVYSSAIKGDGFDDWFCEGMQGDYTDPVITEKRGKDFNEYLYKRLLQRETYSVDEAIADTFDEFTPVMMKVSVKNGSKFSSFLLITIILFLGSGASLAFAIFKTKVPAKYKHAVPCDLNAVYQGSCNFCGGIYIIGMHHECPHCGAVLPPQNYVQDPQGNVIRIFNNSLPGSK